MKAPIAALATLAVLVLAACGTITTDRTAARSHAAAAHSPAAVSPAAPALSCARAGNTIATLVADQNSQNKSLQENWVQVSDGSFTSQGQDLSTATSLWAGAPQVNQLGIDASQLSSDAQTFLNDQSGGLYPGWVGEYRLVAGDIRNLARDCGYIYHDDSWYLNHH